MIGADGSEQYHLKGRMVSILNPADKSWNIWDPEIRVTEMKKAGFDKQVLIANQRMVSDYLEGKSAVALAHAYNTAVGECLQKHEEFIGAAQVPSHDIEEMVKEAERAVNDLGFKTIRVHANIGGRNFDDPALRPFFAKLVEMNVPLWVHPIGYQAPGETYPHLLGGKRLAKYGFAAILGFPLEFFVSIGSLIFGGVLKEFPNLKVCFLEGGVGFVPYLMGRLEEAHEVLTSDFFTTLVGPSESKITNSPVDYLNQLYFAIEANESALAPAISQLGADNLVIGSDFPHPEGSHPNTISQLMEVEGISSSDKEKIAGKNAERLLGV